jgi:hypothetical protein
MQRVRIVAGLLLVFGFAGCGSSTQPTPLLTVDGHWEGTITSPADGVGTIAGDLSQSGSIVTGSLLLSQPGLPDARGTFNGTLESGAGVVTLRYTAFYDYGDGCTGTYGGVLSGTYVGQNCAHTFTGTMRIDRSSSTRSSG